MPGGLERGTSAVEREALVPDLLSRRFAGDSRSYWEIVWSDLRRNRVATMGIVVMAAMAALGVLAPFIANHRPLAMRVDGESPAPGVSAGWSFPLAAALTPADWVLLGGTLIAIVATMTYRRAKRRDGEAARWHVVTLSVIGMAPIVAAAAWSPALHGRRGETDAPFAAWFAWPWMGWAFAGIVTAAGVAIMLWSIRSLWVGLRDAFGRRRPGSHLLRLVVGSLLALYASSIVGSLGQREIDATDYVAMSKRDGVIAVFPPIPHDYAATQTTARNQPPGAPFVRVQPIAGSDAAADLGLTDSRRSSNLSDELPPEESTGEATLLTRGTLLADLRFGAGARLRSDGRADFNIVTTSVERIPVSLQGAVTVGDAMDRIESASGARVLARLRADGGGIDLFELERGRPIHWLGTDRNGSDVAARLISATRVALSIGFVSTGIAVLIGVIVGALMGYFGGWVDIAGMRIIEIFMAIPRLFLLLTIIAFIPPQWNEYMLYAMMAVIGATSWMTGARFIRAEFMKLRDQDFVQAARACGLPLRSVLFRHMLPNGVTPVLVDASFSVAAAILLETGLSFLGFGIKPPEPSWGQMLADAVDTGTGVFYPWLAIFPGLIIFLTVFSCNVVGDALRDAIDPKLKKAAH